MMEKWKREGEPGIGGIWTTNTRTNFLHWNSLSQHLQREEYVIYKTTTILSWWDTPPVLPSAQQSLLHQLSFHPNNHFPSIQQPILRQLSFDLRIAPESTFLRSNNRFCENFPSFQQSLLWQLFFVPTIASATTFLRFNNRFCVNFPSFQQSLLRQLSYDPTIVSASTFLRSKNP